MGLWSWLVGSLLWATVVAMQGCQDAPVEDPPPSGRPVKLGFLSSFRGGGKLFAGAVPLAIRAANRGPLAGSGVHLTFQPADSGTPGSPDAVRAMTVLRDRGAAGFLGPDHSCRPEALVAAAWHLTMVAYGCADRRVSDKNIYRTFARTLPPSSKVMKSVVALLRHFSWRTAALVVANNAPGRQAEEAFLSVARSYHVNVSAVRYLPGDYMTRDSSLLRKIILETAARTRVYVLIVDHFALVDMARDMYQLGMLSQGEYVVISVEQEELFDPGRTDQITRKVFEVAEWNQSDPAPFHSVLIVSPGLLSTPRYDNFSQQVLNMSAVRPFCVPMHPDVHILVPIYAGLVYDAVLLYATALAEVLAANGSEFDGEAIVERMLSRRYNSILGRSVYIDENGDAEGNYTVLAFSDDQIQPVGRFEHSELGELPVFILERPIQWVGGRPPASEPVCGFNGEHCDSGPDWKYISISCVFIIFLVIGVFFSFKRYNYERKLACLMWKVDIRDVKFLRTDSDYNLQNIRNTVMCRKHDSKMSVTAVEQRSPYLVGFYRGNAVYIKAVYKKSVDLTRSVRKEMIQIREMRHENIAPFIGACVDHPNISIITLFSARGSLEDVLMRNEDVMHDNMFVASLVADLIKGMVYLHNSVIVSHGNLRSSNCLVDSRWVLQISDFGLHEFRANQDYPLDIMERKHHSLLWRAPELLKDPSPPPRGTQKGDIYSFAIVLYEIVGRAGPWGPDRPSLKFVEEKLVHPEHYGGIYRPPTSGLDCPDYLVTCIEDCWVEDPESRPDFVDIGARLRKLQPDLKANILDNMIARMEKHAFNLEGRVEERTKQLLEEKKKTENLLLRMLPKPVADQLKRGEPVEAETFDSVTIYFSDIVDFTALSALSTPLQVVELLNDLYTRFDSVIEDYDVYKVETIGDAYMVVSGLPLRNRDRHVTEVADMSLRLQAAGQDFRPRHRPEERLKLRIGIHTGPCVAGVVGLKMPRYCLFGDTVNTASRMESTGEAFKIHVSEATVEILRQVGGYVVQERGLTPIKGKGVMRTYWLLGRTGERPDLLPPEGLH